MKTQLAFNSTAYIALGSNLADPKNQVEQAIHTFAKSTDMQLNKQSSLYRTAPVGYDNQPDFINAVIEIKTNLSPLELLHHLFEIENKQGRERPFPNAPRVLDLDLLMYDQVKMETGELNLPHPRMHERGFVMLPFAEIAPDVMIGNYGLAKTLAHQCQNQGVFKL
jgi:2-amino-4-hydroxy-6-hydroxymethyldihydropteridine diphosphokinase